MSQEIQQVAQQIIVACSQFFDPSISPEQRQSISMIFPIIHSNQFYIVVL